MSRVGWLVTVAALCIGAGGAWWVASSSQSPEQAAARAAEPDASWVTETVELRVLSKTLIERGDVQAESSVSVLPPVSVEPPAVITNELLRVGDDVDEGSVVVEVSGRPVFVVEGPVPMYRSLRPEMTGNDVALLQTALTRLGFETDDIGFFGEQTKAAVSAWYRSAGYEPLRAFDTEDVDIAAAEQAVSELEAAVEAASTALADAEIGPSELEVSQADAAVQQAQRGLEAAHAQRMIDVRLAEEAYNAAVRARDRLRADPTTPSAELDVAESAILESDASLGATRRSSDDAVASAAEALLLATVARRELDTPPDVAELQRAVDNAVAAKAQAERALAAVRAQNGPMVPLGEVLVAPSLPARVRTAATTDPGGPVGEGDQAPDQGLMEFSGGSLVVSTMVRPDDADLVWIGMPVELLDETTSTVHLATVASIADEPITGDDGQVGLLTVMAPTEPLPDNLVGANLRVTITSASTDSEVFVVPVAAVSSAADGSTRVSVVSSVNDPEPVDVIIEAGLSADGFVAVTPVDDGALSDGDMVVVGR